MSHVVFESPGVESEHYLFDFVLFVSNSHKSDWCKWTVKISGLVFFPQKRKWVRQERRVDEKKKRGGNRYINDTSPI